MNQNEKKKDNRSTLIIVILLLITLLAVSVTIWALFFRTPDVILNPDYAPQETEKNQQPIEGDTGDKMENPQGGGAVSLSYSTKVTIDLSEEEAKLNFGNPGKSTQDMVVQIVIQDQILVQSGKLTPGNRVTVLDLLEGAAAKLTPGGYEGKFVVLYYDPETGEKAVVNTEIPISVTVQE